MPSVKGENPVAAAPVTTANNNNRDVTKIVVAIATLDRPRHLATVFHALQSMVTQGVCSLQPEFIVVDNGVHADTRKVCQLASRSLVYPIQYVEEPKVGLCFARNKVIDMALQTDASLIAFIDDDNIPDPDWLIQIVARQRATGAGMVLGYLYALKADGTKEARLKLAGTGNMLVTKEFLQAHAPDGNLFSQHFNFIGSEDKDVIIRAQRLGVKVVSAISSTVGRLHNAPRSTVRGMWRMGFKSGYGEVVVVMCHRDKKRLFGLCALVVRKIAQLVIYASVLSPFLLLQSVRAKNSYRLGKASGVLYALFGGNNVHYYGTVQSPP